MMLVPLVSPIALESTKRAVSAPGVPLKLAAGTKRKLVAAARYRAEVSVRVVETLNHVVPLNHCHVP